MYKQEIEGFSELNSIINTCPEPMILELANLVRDPSDPYSFTNKVLLDMALKKAADLTEVEYWLEVLRKREFPR